MKKTIRLTESDLHRIVKESVNRIIREGKVVNHKPVDFDKIRRDRGYDEVSKAQGKHISRKYGPQSKVHDKLGLRKTSLDLCKRIGFEPDEFDSTIQGIARYYREHPHLKAYRDSHLCPHIEDKKRKAEYEAKAKDFEEWLAGEGIYDGGKSLPQDKYADLWFEFERNYSDWKRHKTWQDEGDPNWDNMY